jgi:hypothetical protein
MNRANTEEKVKQLCEARLEARRSDLNSANIVAGDVELRRHSEKNYFSEVVVSLQRNGRPFDAIELPVFINDKPFLDPDELASKFDAELAHILSRGARR